METIFPIAEERSGCACPTNCTTCVAGQGLIVAIPEMNAIDALIAGSAHERWNVVRMRMEELVQDLHRIAWELRPPAIDELGLKKALGSYIVDWSEQCGTDVDFHCDDPNIDDVPSEIGTAIYRIVQEGLTTIVYAQQPSTVIVVVGRIGSNISGDYRGQRLRFRRRRDTR